MQCRVYSVHCRLYKIHLTYNMQYTVWEWDGLCTLYPAWTSRNQETGDTNCLQSTVHFTPQQYLVHCSCSTLQSHSCVQCKQQSKDLVECTAVFSAHCTASRGRSEDSTLREHKDVGLLISEFSHIVMKINNVTNGQYRVSILRVWERKIHIQICMF